MLSEISRYKMRVPVNESEKYYTVTLYFNACHDFENMQIYFAKN